MLNTNAENGPFHHHHQKTMKTGWKVESALEAT